MLISPSLFLEFTTANLDSRVTFTRSNNTATRINSAGLIESVAANVPRFDFALNTGGVCRGLLIEEARTNLLLHSASIDTTTSWDRFGTTSVSANATVSPDGSSNADRLSLTSPSSGMYQPVNGTAGLRYVFSVYLKSASTANIRLVINTNLSDPTVQTVALTNTWQRFAISKLTNAGTTLVTAQIQDSGSGNTVVDVWGAQLEIGPAATSYIPTTTDPVTRNADVATITGANFSDWWQASKGGVLVRARPSTVSGVRPWVQFDDGTANEIIAMRGNTTDPELYIVDGGVVQAQIDAGTIAANTEYSMTAWWQTNDCKARLNNGAVVTDTTATIPTVTQARLGSDGTNYLNGHLASISYYDTFSGQIYTRRKNKAVFSLL